MDTNSFPTPFIVTDYTNAISPDKKILLGNQSYECKLRSVRVRVVVPKKKNYTRFLLVGSLCRLQDLMSPKKNLSKREMRIDLQLGKKLTRHEAGAAMRLAGKAGDNRDSVYFCDLPINMKTIELQHDDDDEEEEDSNFVLQGELDPRTWTLKGHMGNLSLQKKIEMLNTPITGAS